MDKPHRKVSAEEAIRAIRPGDTVYIEGGCGEPQTLVEALVEDKERLKGTHLLDSRVLPGSKYAKLTDYFHIITFHVSSDLIEGVKSGAVDPKMMVHEGPARVFENEEETTRGIMNGDIKKGDVIVIRYEGPKGGPGMREMLTPTSLLSGMALDKDVALITDGRFSGGTKGAAIGHGEVPGVDPGPIQQTVFQHPAHFDVRSVWKVRRQVDHLELVSIAGFQCPLSWRCQA